MDIEKCEDLPVFGFGILRSEVSGAALVRDLVVEVGITKETLKLFMFVVCEHEFDIFWVHLN